jgi:hypothetical protein
MKKIMIKLMLTGIFMIAMVAGNHIFAGISSPYSPEGDKKVKKEASKTSKKATDNKTATIKQENSETWTFEEEQISAEETSDPHTPYNNFDCTKEGFDRE